METILIFGLLFVGWLAGRYFKRQKIEYVTVVEKKDGSFEMHIKDRVFVASDLEHVYLTLSAGVFFRSMALNKIPVAIVFKKETEQLCSITPS